MVDWAGFEPAASASFCTRACEGSVHTRLNYQPPFYRLNQRPYLTLLKRLLAGKKQFYFMSLLGVYSIVGDARDGL